MYNTSVIIDEVIDALGDFIDLFVDGAEIVRAQVNRVPMPLDNCVVLTELFGVSLSRPYQDFTEGQIDITDHTRVDMQVDFYGSSSADFCKAVQAAFRTSYAYNKFPDNIKPLYTSDGIQSPLVSGEQQWVSRWTLTVSLQYNPVVTIPQESATVLESDLNVLF